MVINGKSVCGGIAIGKIAIFGKDNHQVKREEITDTAAETARFEAARLKAKGELERLRSKTLDELGEADAAIFEVHQMLLDDLDYVGFVTNMIEAQRVNAEYAVDAAGDKYAAMFAQMDDEYMKERAADVKDISRRVIKILQGVSKERVVLDEPAVLLADDLSPSETVLLDKSKTLALVTRHGSSNSHTAILARTMNIPALIGVEFSEDAQGQLAIVDAYEGRLIIAPDEGTLAAYEKRRGDDEKKKRLLMELKGKDNVTLDGKYIDLYANVGSLEDVAAAVANDAGGIGLFRSEFLYLGCDDYPSEEEQFSAYRRAAEMMAGRKVIIRTLDIGADKRVGYFNLGEEENPALGYRAIRICLDRTDIFKTQLRAIYRASVYGDVSIMFPMIISVEEVQKIKGITEEVKSELANDGISYRDAELGIMIETPAAVMMSAELAREVDFFSVGTNDLTQYTLAVDRQNQRLEGIYSPRHPAIMKMLKIIVENGHAGGCRVGICGELGADTTLTEELLKMGFDELSVAPSAVLNVRDAIRKTRLAPKNN